MNQSSFGFSLTATAAERLQRQPVAELSLPLRTINSLERAGIVTVWALLKTERLPRGVGKKAREEIVRQCLLALRSHGVTVVGLD